MVKNLLPVVASKVNHIQIRISHQVSELNCFVNELWLSGKDSICLMTMESYKDWNKFGGYAIDSNSPSKDNLASSLEHDCFSPPLCCQTYWRSSLRLLCTGISLMAQGTATWNLDSSLAYSEVIRSLYLLEPMASPVFICRMCQNGLFFLKLSPLLVLVTLLSAHPKIYLFWSSSSLIPTYSLEGKLWPT